MAVIHKLSAVKCRLSESRHFSHIWTDLFPIHCCEQRQHDSHCVPVQILTDLTVCSVWFFSSALKKQKGGDTSWLTAALWLWLGGREVCLPASTAQTLNDERRERWQRSRQEIWPLFWYCGRKWTRTHTLSVAPVVECVMCLLSQVNYTQPLVAVKFLNASVNTDINVECKINSNTLADGSDRDKFAGRISFKLRINDK